MNCVLDRGREARWVGGPHTWDIKSRGVAYRQGKGAEPPDDSKVCVHCGGKSAKGEARERQTAGY